MKSEHTSGITGRRWDAFTSVYYDCHVVSLGQVAPRALFYDWLLICALPSIEEQWSGVSCRNILDSEPARDLVLLDQMGVVKRQVPIRGDITATMEATVRAQGYCIARVDSYYHAHFEEFFKKQHRTNGHKVTVVDWVDENYYGIDNVGIKTLVMDFKKDWFMESIRSNLFHVYEKEDTFYHFDAQSLEAAVANAPRRAELVGAAVSRWYAHRRANIDAIPAYAARFEREIEAPEPRGYAQQHNSYTSALMIETAYTAVHEAWSHDQTSLSAIARDSTASLAALKGVIQAWRMFKLLLKGRESGQPIPAAQLVKVLGQLVDRERAFNESIGLAEAAAPAAAAPAPAPQRSWLARPWVALPKVFSKIGTNG